MWLDSALLCLWCSAVVGLTCFWLWRFVFMDHVQKFRRIMRGTQGAFIVASTLQIILGFSGLWRNVTRLVSTSGLHQFSMKESLVMAFINCSFSYSYSCSYLFSFRFLSPLSAVPLVALAGFGLYELGFPAVSVTCLFSSVLRGPFFVHDLYL